MPYRHLRRCRLFHGASSHVVSRSGGLGLRGLEEGSVCVVDRLECALVVHWENVKVVEHSMEYLAWVSVIL